MAWTTPRTWTTDELVTASMMNTHVRDNLNALYAARKMKAVDETVNNTTTLQDDADFSFAVLANEKWAVEIVCKIVSNSGPDFKFDFSVPSGTTYNHSVLHNSGGPAALVNWASTAGSIITDGTAGGNMGLIQAYFIVSSTAGTVQFQWAQNSTEATNTTLKAGSFMIAQRCD